MHCRIILPLTLAAIFFAAGPALSQRVPLILDRTIELPCTSNVWDVMPHPDGYYVWVQAIEPDAGETRLYWGRSGVQTFDSLDLAVGTPQSVDAFFRNDHESCVVLASRHYEPCVEYGELEIPVDSTHFRIVSLTAAQADTHVWIIPPYCYNLGWPVLYHVMYDFCLSALIRVPPPPLSSTRLFAFVSYWMAGLNTDYSGSIGTQSCVIPNMLSATSSPVCPGMGGIATDWCLTDGMPRVGFASYSDVGMGPGNYYSVFWFGTGHLVGDSLISDGGFSHTCPMSSECHPRMVGCTFDTSTGRLVCFAGYSSHIGGMTDPDSGFAWLSSINYSLWLAVECVPSNSAEEFLCYTRSRAAFDVLDAVDGHSYGVTDTVDIATSGARIIGRYDSTFRRLVIRDSTSLKLYRFGEYLAADEHPVSTPSDLSLAAYPNPFNPSSTIRFSLPRRTEAELVVYDVTGRQVSVLVDEVLAAGEHRVPFDGARLPSGIYFTRLIAGEAQATQKLLLLK